MNSRQQPWASALAAGRRTVDVEAIAGRRRWLRRLGGGLWLALWLWVLPVSAAEPVLLSAERSQLAIGRQLQLLEDPSRQLDLAAVRSAALAGRWRSSTAEVPNLGFSASAYWLRFRLDWPATDRHDWLLVLAYPLLDRFTIYFPTAGGAVRVREGGDQLTFADGRDLRSRYFVYRLPRDLPASAEIYLRVETESSVQLPLSLWRADLFAEQIGRENFGQGAYLGVMLVMALYNLFLFLVVRERSYLYYVAYICAFALFSLAVYGHAYAFLWPGSPWLANHMLLLSNAAAVGTAALFTASLLELRQRAPRLYRGFQGALAVLLLLALNSLVTPYALNVRLFALYNLLLLGLIIAAGTLTARQGYRPARYFLLAWAALLLGSIAFSFKLLGWLPANFFTEFGVQIGSALEVILLSFALGDRISLLRAEKEAAQAEALRQQAQAIANLKDADRLKDELLANTSHELRTPLHGIIGLGESLVEGAAGPVNGEQADILQMLIGSARRLGRLVDDILDLSRMRAQALRLELKPLDVAAMVEVSLALARPLLAGKPLQLRSELAAGLPAVLADEDRLQQILLNLLGNAIKFTHQGEVCVRAQLDLEAPGQLQIAVSDSGIGIDPAQQERIFEAFEQADGGIARQYGGSGLGLSVCRRLVELHGGRLWVDSRPGAGSTFRFTLPLAPWAAATLAPAGAATATVDLAEPVGEPAAASASTAPPATLPAPSSRVTAAAPAGRSGEADILVVDDEPVNLQVLRHQLQLQGYQVRLAEQGAAALSMIAATPPDLLLLDVMMPQLSGLEVCRRLREVYDASELPIILLTAKSQPSDVLMGLDSGANDYLVKPFNRDELLARVRTQLALKRALQILREWNRALEQQVAERTQQLLLQAKMVSLGTLTAGVAHEINNPTNYTDGALQNLIAELESLHGFLRQLAGEDAPPEVMSAIAQRFSRLDEMIATARQGCARITAIVGELRQFTRLGEAEHKCIAIAEPILSTLNLVRSRFQRIQFETELSFNPALDGQPAKLGVLFMALVINACEAVERRWPDGGGKVRIASRPSTDGAAVEIDLSDDGCGIDPGIRERIFEPFFTTKDVGAGTGMSLAIAFAIVHDHGGTIAVASTPGEGSCFTLRLLLHRSAA